MVSRLTSELPLFVVGAAVGALVGVAVAGGWGVKRRWVVAVALALGMGYLAVWAGDIVAGFTG